MVYYPLILILVVAILYSFVNEILFVKGQRDIFYEKKSCILDNTLL